ncbi:MAG: substrate-binding domain-containing protein [Bacillota bacterium]|nr:substrate-binding domain-containing protein [Bacillota bacterium]
MKKYITGALSVLLIGGMLAGCGTQSSSDNSKGSTGKSTSNNKEVDMIISTLNNPFFVSLKNGAEAEAKKLGIKLVVQNANNDNQTELNLAQTDILKKPAALILDPVDSNAIVTSIKLANKNHIPVFAFDRKPTGGDLETFLGYDAIKAGQVAADALAKVLNEKGKVIEIQGIMGTNVAQDRSKGFEEEIAKFPNIQVVAKQPANFDRAQALNVMTNLIQAHPDVNGVYAANDEMAMGVVSALKARGLTGKVLVVGNDGIKDALDAITAGTLAATNAESPFYEGMQVVDIAKDILDGKQVQPDTTLEGQLVTKDNVDQYWEHLKQIGDPED